MLKEKRINYAIGLIFSILILGFMSAPYFGEATCYGLLDVFSIMKLLGENSPLITTVYAFEIMALIEVSLLSILGISGFVLNCINKYRHSKLENVISVIYSSLLFVIIATMFVLLILSLKWLIDADLKVKYGFIVLFAIIYLLPYFCATKFNLVFALYMTVCIPSLGIVFLILHDKIFKSAYQKTTS